MVIRLTWGGGVVWAGLGWAGWLAGLWAGGSGKGANTKPNAAFLGLVCFNTNQTQVFWVWFGRRGGLGGLGRGLGVLGSLGPKKRSFRTIKRTECFGGLGGVLAGLGRVLLGGFGCVWGLVGAFWGVSYFLNCEL